jgi:hypothetical protein
MTTTTTRARFELGRTFATPGALRALEDARMTFMPYLRRHSLGDWGDVSDEDKRLNDADVSGGGRLLSCYKLPGAKGDRARIWIITEADRSATTILCPEEY